MRHRRCPPKTTCTLPRLSDGLGLPVRADYLHWWQLDALGPSRTKIVDYELLKGSTIKFWLGATGATVKAHTQMQANIQAWARSRKSSDGSVA